MAVILGIWDGHDSGAALLVDGRVEAAVNEERLTRRKLEVAFPRRSIRECLSIAARAAEEVAVVAASTTDPSKTLGRLQPWTKESYYLHRRRKTAPGAGAELRAIAKYRLTEWPPNALSRWLSRYALRRELASCGLHRAALRLFDHHECHAAAAAAASGFDSCVVVTMDGVGDGKSATVSRYKAGRLEPLRVTPARHSAGVFFEHVTHLLNMRELEDEGKVMALADYASPVPDDRNPLRQLLFAEDGCFRTARPGHALRAPLRRVHWGVPNEQFAYMAQRALEDACSSLVAGAVAASGEHRVALAGGIASNVKVNRRLRTMPGVEDVFVFPHMGDGGLAFGAAVLASGMPRTDLHDVGLGRAYEPAEIAAALDSAGLVFSVPRDIAEATADQLIAGSVVMWFQGRMEYGPRALGHRSVLARPDRPELRDRLNLVLKRRVWYQPFCPSMLESEARRMLSDFDGRPNRHMTMAYQVAAAARSQLSGVTSVDGTCRPQMVEDTDPGPFASLLREMRMRIGIGALLNTSYNIHGLPLVCSPTDAIAVFVESGADWLAAGPYLVERRR